MKNFVFLSSIFCCILSTEIFAKPDALDRIVAVVDDDVILMSELQEYADTKNKQKNINSITFQSKILEKLIQKKIIGNFLKANNIGVDDALISMAIKQIADRNKLSVEDLYNKLPEQNLTPSLLREQIRDKIERNKLQQFLVRNHNEISPIELKLMMQALAKKLKVSITTDELYQVEYILVKDELLAQKINNQLKVGRKFSQLAHYYSDSPSALFGGNLGTKALVDLPEDIQPTVASMEVDEIKIFNNNGWYIVHLIGKKKNSKTIEIIKQQATELILERKLDRYLDKLLSKLEKEAYIERRL